MISTIFLIISNLHQVLGKLVLPLRDRSIHQKALPCLEQKLACLHLPPIASTPQPNISHLITSCLLFCTNCLFWFLPDSWFTLPSPRGQRSSLVGLWRGSKSLVNKYLLTESSHQGSPTESPPRCVESSRGVTRDLKM